MTQTPPRQINAAGLKIIQESENLELTAYRDEKGIPTIGWGHRIVASDNLKIGDSISRDLADRLLEMDLRFAEEAVTKFTTDPILKPGINGNRFSALVSLVYNIGGHAFETSELRLWVMHQSWQNAADQFLRWNHVDGKVSDGLTTRREKERALFLTPVDRAPEA
jgi:lysozyme